MGEDVGELKKPEKSGLLGRFILLLSCECRNKSGIIEFSG